MQFDSFRAGFDAFNAQLYLDAWIHAAALQHQRLRQHPPPSGRPEFEAYVREWLAWQGTHTADTLMLALVLDQVAVAAKAVGATATNDRAKIEIGLAIKKFRRVCRDLRRVRNVLAHVDEYVVGQGRPYRSGHVRAEFPYPEHPDFLLIVVNDGDDTTLLEIDFAEAVHATSELRIAIALALG